MKALYGHADDRGAEPSVIAETIVEAVTARRPKVRYATPFSAKAIIAAVTLVPDRVLDAGLRAVMSRLRPEPLLFPKMGQLLQLWAPKSCSN